jgi:LysM repeat protein
VVSFDVREGLTMVTSQLVTSELRRPALRLTRRGRVVLLGLFVSVASLSSAVLFTTASRASDPEVGPAPTVVVQPHDTLWSIASRTSPRTDPYAAVADLKRLNNLDGYVVHPGETLVVTRTP